MIRLLFLTGISILSASSATAFPAVGDHVEFMAKYQNRAFILEKSVKSHDPVNDHFGVRTLLRSGDQVLRDELFLLPRSFLYNPEKIAHVLATCVSREGALGNERIGEKIVRVCEFYHEDSQLTTILGNVPFGQVRFQEYLGEGEFLDYHLTRFEHGI